CCVPPPTSAGTGRCWVPSRSPCTTRSGRRDPSQFHQAAGPAGRHGVRPALAVPAEQVLALRASDPAPHAGRHEERRGRAVLHSATVGGSGRQTPQAWLSLLMAEVFVKHLPGAVTLCQDVGASAVSGFWLTVDCAVPEESVPARRQLLGDCDPLKIP